MYLMYGKPEVSCNSLVDMYLGKRSASLMKEFCNFCNFRSLVTVSETVIVEITTYWKSILFLHIVYRFAKLFVSLVLTFD